MQSIKLLKTLLILLAVAELSLMTGACGRASETAEASNASANDQTEQADYDEAQIGRETFDELKQRGEIVKSSPLYDSLTPIASMITEAAQPQYQYPFKFYVIHSPEVNAFSAPGGNVYVTDSILYSLKNEDELAAILCHEVSHAIHHDTINLMKKKQEIWKREVAADLIFGRSLARVVAIGFLGHLNSLGFSREVEEQADLTGADICSQTGYNPWGLVWFLSSYQSQGKNVPEWLSDHPNDQKRIDALENHFKEQPKTFGRFKSDPASGTSMTVPDDAPEVFMR